MWSDNETSEDLFGFQVHADLIREVVADRSLLPVTLGVFGDWGNGKTSIMQMLRHDLDPASYENPALGRRYENVAVLYFNGWLFEGYDDAKSALISSILEQLAEHQRFGPKVRHKAAALIKRVNWMRVAKFGMKEMALPAIAAYATGGISAVPSLMKMVGSAFASTKDEDDKDTEGEDKDGDKKKEDKKLSELIKEAPEEDGPSDVRSFREDFEKLIKESTIETLVVLIDDLDRCSPERLIENLEAIKLFLNVPDTAFIIGADPRIVRHAIAVRYRESLTAAREDRNRDRDADRLVTDYLEKLIQVPYHLPKLSPAEIETYMALLFAKRDLPATEFARCLQYCRAERTRNRFRCFGLADFRKALEPSELPEKLVESLNICAAASGLITENLKGNPRQVKRFLNAYFLRRKLAEVAGMLPTYKDQILIKLMLLEYADFERFLELSNKQAEDKGYPSIIRRLEQAANGDEDSEDTSNLPPLAAEWSRPNIQRWAEMEPKLTGVDLSDYFWLARDKLGSSSSGLSLVPPLIRQLLTDLLAAAKRKAAAVTCQGLSPADLDLLHQQLTRQLLASPSERNVFQAFETLVEKRPESAAAYAQAIRGLPIKKLGAWLDGSLRVLSSGNAERIKAFEPIFSWFEGHPETTVGKAAKAEAARTKRK